MNKALTVYKASAGSGKTFTLATEYIRMLVENPQSYRNILAVTFTNKATEEMKMRILSQLYGISHHLKASSDYMDAIRKKTGYSEAYISKQAGLSLSNLLHNYNYFRVETIDTFFQSVLRNLARELDLTANLRIGLNDVQVEEMAVDQLIENLNRNDRMLQWLLKYIMENISDDKSWNVIGQIKTFGKNIFQDAYKESADQLGERLQEPHFFEHYTSTLKEIRQGSIEQMKALAEQFFEAIEAEGLTFEDFSYGKTGVCGFFQKLHDGIFDESVLGKRVADCIGVPEKWCKKTHPRREAIHQLVETTLNPILRQASDERPRQWKLYQSADLTLRHLSQLRLLSSIETKVRELNNTANRFLLSDTQQLLHALIDGSDSPFIFEKIGTQLEHVMIDEFQDTSTVQWENFKVLLSEAMSHENADNLIVGDVKQSIYRWRSGDWRLLNNIHSQFQSPEQQLDIRSLDTNYRSHRRIVDFNNSFFLEAARLEYLALDNDPEAEQLQRAYADVQQKVPEKKKDDGYVSIQLFPSDDYQQRVLDSIIDTVDLLHSLGVSDSSIAILVRTNSLIPLIAEYFASKKPDVRIVSDEAFRLDASQAVRLLVKSLYLMNHPEDELTKAETVKIYQSLVIGNNSPDNAIIIKSQTLDELLPKDYIQHLEELQSLPLYELAEQLYDIFGLSRLKEQSAYVCAFFDRLADYVNENATDINAFIKEWETNLCNKTIQSDEINGIRLLSIHKSKGLEFEHVIMPFCDWQLEKSSGNILWCRPAVAPFDEMPLAPIDYSEKGMTGTIYEKDYRQEHLQNTVDNLNLLYVAFTRARKSLFIFGRRKAKGGRSMLIEQSLPLVTNDLPGAMLSGTDDEQSDLIFEYGRQTPEGKTAASPSATDKQDNPFLQPSTTYRLQIQTFHNKVAFRQSNRSKDFIEGDDDDNQQRSYIQMGSVLHQVFSTINTAADIGNALQQLQLEGVLYDENITSERITSMLQRRLQDPRVADWFSDRWKLFNECTILSTEDGQVKERRPDRVMTDGKQWIVVDFKFGKPKAEYEDQVREYMQLIASMGHRHVTGYLWFVYSNKIIEVK